MLDQLTPEGMFVNDEQLQMFEQCLHMFDELMTDHPHWISEETFEEDIFEHVAELMHDQFENDLFYSEECIDQAVTDAMHFYFEHCCVPRSYPTSCIIDLPNVETITDQINYLRSRPQPVQRTPEWYMFRYMLITASNAYKAFGSEKVQNQLIWEKCKPLLTEDSTTAVVNTNTTLHWGQKFERVSVMLYEREYATTIEEFGCIQHDQYSFLGASPDGINVDPSNPRFGRMLEIKNVVNREITGIPKQEYWVQMQLQMEVCNLNECDFLETQFKEYDSHQEFEQDPDKDTHTTGVFLQFSDECQRPMYVYMPLDCKVPVVEWIEQTVDAHTSHLFIRPIFWKLEIMSCVLVCRNSQWFKHMVPQLQCIWDTILHERVHGYEHRMPTKRPAKELTNEESIENKCLIVVKLNETVIHDDDDDIHDYEHDDDDDDNDI